MSNHDTIYYTPNPAEPSKVKGINAHTYVQRYKRMANDTLKRLMETPYTLTASTAPSLSGGTWLRLELKTHAFSFRVHEVFGEDSEGNGKTVRNELLLAGHSVGSFCHWALACESAVAALHQTKTMGMYNYKRQLAVGDDVWVYEFPKEGKLNSPSVFISFDYGVISGGSMYRMAHVQVDGQTDRLEELDMDEIPLPNGALKPRGQGGTHSRALIHSLTNAPFTLILSAATHLVSFVEENHCVYFGQQDFS